MLSSSFLPSRNRERAADSWWRYLSLGRSLTRLSGSASHIVLGVGLELVSLNAGAGHNQYQRFGGRRRGRECLSKQLRGPTRPDGGKADLVRLVGLLAAKTDAVCKRSHVLPHAPCSIGCRLLWPRWPRYTAAREAAQLASCMTCSHDSCIGTCLALKCKVHVIYRGDKVIYECHSPPTGCYLIRSTLVLQLQERRFSMSDVLPGAKIPLGKLYRPGFNLALALPE